MNPIGFLAGLEKKPIVLISAGLSSNLREIKVFIPCLASGA
jgi:hypothetical protein